MELHPHVLKSSQMKPLHCESQIKLVARAKSESLSTDALIRFELASSKSKLEILLMNSVLMPFAKVILDDKNSILKDQEGERPLSEFPLFRQWLRKGWWNEIALLFGEVSPTASPYTWVDSKNRPVKYETKGRKVSCSYGVDLRPIECRIEAPNFSADLNFTSVDCRSSL